MCSLFLFFGPSVFSLFYTLDILFPPQVIFYPNFHRHTIVDYYTSYPALKLGFSLIFPFGRVHRYKVPFLCNPDT